MSNCHCGREANGHLRGFCQLCSDVRCDAYPGACAAVYKEYWDLMAEGYSNEVKESKF